MASWRTGARVPPVRIRWPTAEVVANVRDDLAAVRLRCGRATLEIPDR
jgi:hypothetical protein